MGESYKIEIDRRLIRCLEVLCKQLKKSLEQNQSFCESFIDYTKSILNTFIALCCPRKQNLLHFDYELFVYELSLVDSRKKLALLFLLSIK